MSVLGVKQQRETQYDPQLLSSPVLFHSFNESCKVYTGICIVSYQFPFLFFMLYLHRCIYIVDIIIIIKPEIDTINIIIITYTHTGNSLLTYQP